MIARSSLSHFLVRVALDRSSDSMTTHHHDADNLDHSDDDDILDTFLFCCKDSLVGVPGCQSLTSHHQDLSNDTHPVPQRRRDRLTSTPDVMPPRTPSRRANGTGHRSSTFDEFDDDLPVYGVPSSPANPTSGIGPNGGIRPGSGLVPGSTSRKSSENQNHNLNHLLGLRMPPRVVVGSGMGTSVSAGSSAVPRRSRGIKNSFNKDSEYSLALPVGTTRNRG